MISGFSVPLPVADVPAPGWAEDVVPTDGLSDGGASGPSSAGSVDVPSGVCRNAKGADLSAFNPVGPSAGYARSYRSANNAYASPGLSTGWTDNYDLFVKPGSGVFTLTYPGNGATDTWSGTSGLLATPTGAPYMAQFSSGSPNKLTMTFKDRSVYTFTQYTAAGGNYPANGYRVLSVTNDVTPTPTTLLTMNYSGAQLASVVDAYGRTVSDSFVDGNLAAVSQIGTASPLWVYFYSASANQPVLTQVQAPDPSDPSGTRYAQSSTIYMQPTSSTTPFVYMQRDAISSVVADKVRKKSTCKPTIATCQADTLSLTLANELCNNAVFISKHPAKVSRWPSVPTHISAEEKRHDGNAFKPGKAHRATRCRRVLHGVS